MITPGRLSRLRHVHARHVDVGKHGGVAARLPRRRAPRARRPRCRPRCRAAELAHQHFAVDRMIVDHQHRGRSPTAADQRRHRRPRRGAQQRRAAIGRRGLQDASVTVKVEPPAGRALRPRRRRPSAARGGARSTGRGRCRRSGAWSSCRPARTAGTAARAAPRPMPMPVSATASVTRVSPVAERRGAGAQRARRRAR